MRKTQLNVWIAMMFCAVAMAAQGEAEDAQTVLDDALALSHASGARYSGPMILGFVARTTHDADRRRRALHEGEALLAQGCVSHCHLDLYESAIEAALDARQWDEAERYADALDRYTAGERFPWADFQIRRARALAACGRASGGAARKADSAADADRIRGALVSLRDEAVAAGMLGPVARIDDALRQAGGAR